MVETYINEESPNSTEPNLADEDYIRSFEEYIEEYIGNYVENILDYEY